MGFNKSMFFLSLPYFLLVLVAARGAPQHDAPKEEILFLLNQLKPIASGTPDKPHLTEPGYEVEKRVVSKILSIASTSPEMRQLVVQALVDLLEDPMQEKTFFYSRRRLEGRVQRSRSTQGSRVNRRPFA